MIENLDIYIGLLISILSIIFMDGNFGKYLIYYFIFDLLFFSKRVDIIIHHIIVIIMFSTHFVLQFNDFDYKQMFKVIILVEMSNIFLLCNKLLDKKYKKIKNLCNLLFVTTFIYFRIYYYYINALLPDSIVVQTMRKYTDNDIIIGSIFWSFYVLNLYWLSLIIYKLYNLTMRIKI